MQQKELPSNFSISLNPMNGLMKPQENSGLVPFAEADGGLYLLGTSLPTSAAVLLHSKTQGIRRDLGFTCGAGLWKEIPNLLCRYLRAI